MPDDLGGSTPSVPEEPNSSPTPPEPPVALEVDSGLLDVVTKQIDPPSESR